MTAQDVFRALMSVFPSPAHTLLSEVRNGTGWTRRTRTADALAVSNYPSRGLWLAGVEIKLYLGDWKRELADPEKAEAIQRYCRYWYVAAPEGLVPREQLPETWGLIEVGTKTRIAVKAPQQKPKAIDLPLLCSILRNFSETHVPRCDVDRLAAAKAEELENHRARELSQLREQIAEFEGKAGVKLSGWRHGDIGAAVKLVVDSGILYRSDRLQALRAQAVGVAESVDKIFAALEHKP